MIILCIVVCGLFYVFNLAIVGRLSRCRRVVTLDSHLGDFALGACFSCKPFELFCKLYFLEYEHKFFEIVIEEMEEHG